MTKITSDNLEEIFESCCCHTIDLYHYIGDEVLFFVKQYRKCTGPCFVYVDSLESKRTLYVKTLTDYDTNFVVSGDKIYYCEGRTLKSISPEETVDELNLEIAPREIDILDNLLLTCSSKGNNNTITVRELSGKIIFETRSLGNSKHRLVKVEDEVHIRHQRLLMNIKTNEDKEIPKRVEILGNTYILDRRMNEHSLPYVTYANSNSKYVLSIQQLFDGNYEPLLTFKSSMEYLLKVTNEHIYIKHYYQGDGDKHYGIYKFQRPSKVKSARSSIDINTNRT